MIGSALNARKPIFVNPFPSFNNKFNDLWESITYSEYLIYLQSIFTEILTYFTINKESELIENILLLNETLYFDSEENFQQHIMDYERFLIALFFKWEIDFNEFIIPEEGSSIFF